MKITFPRMGTMHVGLKCLLQRLGNEVIVPGRVTADTIDLGAKHAPETACFPLKINLGNYLEILDEHPDIDAILMAGGVGPCRFGYYYRTQQDIMEDLGYTGLDWVVLEPPRGNLHQVLDGLSNLNQGRSKLEILQAMRLAWKKMIVLDDILSIANKMRPYEAKRGDTSKVFRRAVSEIDAADSIREVESVSNEIKQKMHSLKDKDQEIENIKVALVGEIYVNMEPGANMHVEEALGHLGAEAQRTIMITDWAKDNILLDFLRWDSRGKDRKEAARPYLEHFVGGEGQASIGSAALLADDVDGIIHLMPFTCMPEIVAQTIMPEVSDDFDLPVLTLVLDEHSGRAGMVTRLEAFVDLLRRRKRMQEQPAEQPEVVS